MKTLVELDEHLLKEAFRLTGAKTKRQVLNLSLEELVRQKRMISLKQRLGRTGLNLTLSRLEASRNAR